MTKTTTCPCGSGHPYLTCCNPFHKGLAPKTAEKLMRLRYSAYALNLPTYIIKTTHPASSQFNHDLSKWSHDVSEFSQHTIFKSLEILDTQEQDHFATVTFVAHLEQDKKDVSFTERSTFEKIKGKWLYRSGLLSAGHAPNLITTNQLRILPLAYYGDPILRKVAEPVAKITDKIRALVQEMTETVDGCNGIGLAAPQVHHSIQLFIIRKPEESKSEQGKPGEVKVFINPTLSEPSSEKWTTSEGCLSIPSIHGDVERPKEITVDYTDLEGVLQKEKSLSIVKL